MHAYLLPLTLYPDHFCNMNLGPGKGFFQLNFFVFLTKWKTEQYFSHGYDGQVWVGRMIWVAWTIVLDSNFYQFIGKFHWLNQKIAKNFYGDPKSGRMDDAPLGSHVEIPKIFQYFNSKDCPLLQYLCRKRTTIQHVKIIEKHPLHNHFRILFLTNIIVVCG